MKLNLPKSTQNWISLTGAMIALVTLFMIVFLFVISFILHRGGSYMGLIIFILMPPIMIFGLLLIPIGMIRTFLRERKGKKVKAEAWPKVDLNDVRHRNAFFIFSIGTIIFLFLSAIGSYEAYHFTDSVQFCGTLCHTVMHPEYTAYQHSAHARVPCVDCHVGSGANWYVRSKLSGLYQVYAVIANIYPRPIPTPIENLRPARETCEQCHWPQKFYAQTLRAERHYLDDKNNTPWDIKLRLKIGANHSALGLTEGIHWHINPDISIEYIASDDQNEDLPWVRYKNLETGVTKIFQDTNVALDESSIDKANIHVMDCMDCHNRPSHSYRPPAQFVNDAITAGLIPADLPEIKQLSMEICSKEFSQSDAALDFINNTIIDFYKNKYPDIYFNNYILIEKAISGLQEVYSENIFPKMHVRWNEYPNHIGHLYYNGCFRCHNNRHISKDGQRIKKDCNLCHVIDSQGKPGKLEYASGAKALEFRHPVNIDKAWKEGLCTDCHFGLNP